MVTIVPDNSETGPQETCHVIVLYEDIAAREFAARSSKELSEVSPTAGSVEVGWFPFSALADAQVARELAEQAAFADLIVFTSGRAGDWPGEVKLWIETWIGRRGEREGAIVGLMTPERFEGLIEMASVKEVYLRHAAHRAGMDYLSHVPVSISQGLPDSPESCSARAGMVTSVLDEILQTEMRRTKLRR
jgi:hypothetical protein